MGFWDKVREAVTGEPGRRPAEPVSTFGASATPPSTVSATPPVRSEAEEEPDRPQPVAKPDRGGGHRTYTVVNGDTLSEIGARFGVAVSEIAELNRIKSPELIYPGQVFRIPGDDQ